MNSIQVFVCFKRGRICPRGQRETGASKTVDDVQYHGSDVMIRGSHTERDNTFECLPAVFQSSLTFKAVKRINTVVLFSSKLSFKVQNKSYI